MPDALTPLSLAEWKYTARGGSGGARWPRLQGVVLVAEERWVLNSRSAPHPSDALTHSRYALARSLVRSLARSPGSYLASASFDGSIIVWENRNNDSVTWQQATQAYNQNGAAVNSVAWAPYADAKVVAGACADGSILVAELSGGAWQVSTIPDAHDIGAMDVTWAPQVGPHGTRRLATCGCDGAVKVWGFDASSGTWVQEGGNLVGHGDWVRSCDWAPAAGLSSTATVVSAGQDGKVVVWRLVGREWVSSTVCALGKAVWCARWNSNGSLIAVTDEAQTVSLWKQVGDAWMNVS